MCKRFTTLTFVWGDGEVEVEDIGRVGKLGLHRVGQLELGQIWYQSSTPWPPVNVMPRSLQRHFQPRASFMLRYTAVASFASFASFARLEW